MAIPVNLSEINAFTLDMVLPRTTQVIFANDPVWTRLSSRNAEKFTGGLTIRHPIIIGELNGDWFSRGETVNVDYVQTDAAFTATLKFAYVNITLFSIDQVFNRGKLAIFNQVDTKFANASMKMAKMLATAMWLDGTSAGREKCINGLEEWYDDGNSYATIGGLTRNDIWPIGTVGGLNSYVSTLTSFSLSQIRRALTAAWFGPDHVDLLACTPNGYNLIWEALQPAQRYPNASSDNDLARVGFNTFRFDQADVAVSRYMPTGTNGRMFGLNTNYLKMYFSDHELYQFGFTGFKEAQNTIGDVIGQFAVGLNMVCENPRTGFKLKSTLF